MKQNGGLFIPGVRGALLGEVPRTQYRCCLGTSTPIWLFISTGFGLGGRLDNELHGSPLSCYISCLGRAKVEGGLTWPPSGERNSRLRVRRTVCDQKCNLHHFLM